MKLAEVVETSARVRATRSRKEKTRHLARLLEGRTAGELDTLVAWLSGELTQGRIGIGYATSYGARDTLPAEAPTLTVAGVEAAFERIRDTSGPGSKRAREEALGGLLARATGDEQRFLVGLLTGELRQGAQAGLMADGIAAALGVPGDAVRRAAMLAGDLRAVARAALTEGEAGLARFSLQLFRPLQPMLAHTAESPAEALERLGVAAFEDKLDGARIQVHRQGDRVRIYTRQLKEVTAALPEVVEAALALPCEEVVLDGEVVALRPDGRPHPFQTTMRRFGRKLDVAKTRAELPLRPFFFDCLQADGQPLVDAGTDSRWAALESVVPPSLRIRRLLTDDDATARRFLRAALDAGHEGVMAKDPKAPYEAGSRGRAWLKLKPAHTLDLVVLAADWGSGRRKGWLSNLHLGARDPEGGFVMLGKTFKGMTDALLEWQTSALLARVTERTDWTVHVRPELVVEVAFNEIQASPRYPGGMALRFARVKGYRPDKTAAEADTLETVRAIHEGRLAPRLEP